MVASSFPADLESFLSSHHLSPTAGFLPSPPPAVSFTNFEFNIWLFTAKSIPKLLWNYPGEFRKQVDALPLLLFTESCGNIPQWRLAYCALSYIAQAYVWGATVGRPKDEDEAYDEKVLDYIPANIAIPLRHVAFHLGIQPGLTYSAVCTWNWQRKFPTLSSATQERASNLEPIFSFTNTAEEAHYVVTHVMLESAGGQALKLALEASKAAGEKDGDSLEGVLRDLTGAVTKCKQELSLVKEGLDPDVFYSRVKPYLTGLGATNVLPKGVFFRSYPDDPTKGEWIKLSGATASQTCLLPTFDTLLGVTHSEQSCYKYNERMRLAMPQCHVQFLDALTCLPRVKDYVMANKTNDHLYEAYNNAVIALEAYRDHHFSVIGPAKRLTQAERGTRFAMERLGEIRPAAVVAPYEIDAFNKCKSDNVELDFHETKLQPSTVSLAKGSDAICIFVNDKADAETLQKVKESGIKLLALRCTGADNVDLAKAQELGITVVSVPQYSPDAVAEFAVGMMLTVIRKYHKSYSRVRENNFSLEGLLGFNIKERTIGVIGTGAIGLRVARILSHGFGAKVIGYDPMLNPELKNDPKFTYVALDDLLAQADIITLHSPLLPSTEHLINSETIGKMKKGVVLINTSRGGLVDSKALIEGLKSRKISAAGLDVYEKEGRYFFQDKSQSVIQDDVLARLLGFNNVFISGHQAFLTQEALASIAKTTLNNVTTVVNGEDCSNVLKPSK
ncbi:hypothetical protein FRC04_011272 [Tulasnella sp. 424]|nr:hypothetical protein FRC04_011272 [Tulasnella sp. 424]KAG8971811.1 hypothetical protein FRC05_010771 [Tulasnella sp. 425]